MGVLLVQTKSPMASIPFSVAQLNPRPHSARSYWKPLGI